MKKIAITLSAIFCLTVFESKTVLAGGGNEIADAYKALQGEYTYACVANHITRVSIVGDSMYWQYFTFQNYCEKEWIDQPAYKTVVEKLTVYAREGKKILVSSTGPTGRWLGSITINDDQSISIGGADVTFPGYAAKLEKKPTVDVLPGTQPFPAQCVNLEGEYVHAPINNQFRNRLVIRQLGCSMIYMEPLGDYFHYIPGDTFVLDNVTNASSRGATYSAKIDGVSAGISTRGYYYGDLDRKIYFTETPCGRPQNNHTKYLVIESTLNGKADCEYYL